MTTRRKAKNSENVDDDFETFVRNSLIAIQKDLSGISKDINDLKEKVSTNDKAISGLKTLLDNLNERYEHIRGEIHDYACKIDALENDLTAKSKATEDFDERINKIHERTLHLERYSRDFNLRFNNIPEEQGEDCIKRLQDIIYYDLNGLSPEIENAHRTGKSIPGKPRTIIAKFLYRPERKEILRQKRNLSNGVWVTEDLIWEDLQKKKQLKEVMKTAFQQGKKPRFHHGNLYLNGQLYNEYNE